MKLFKAKNILIHFLLCFIPNTMSLTTLQFRRQDSGQREISQRSNERLLSVLKALSDNGLPDEGIAEQEEKFKIVTCMSTACSRKRSSLGMDDLCTFGAMYSRASASRVKVEEGPCIGFCKKAPCVSIEHEDFFGSVALEGMATDEFASDAYV